MQYDTSFFKKMGLKKSGVGKGICLGCFDKLSDRKKGHIFGMCVLIKQL